MAETVQESFDELAKGIEQNSEKAKEINAIYQFDVTGEGGGSWTVDLTRDSGWVSQGKADNAQCTIELSGEDWLAIMNQTLNPMQAFMMGKLRVSGDMGLATKLGTVFEMGG
jgi:putative sterol carrier protein